MFQINRCVFLNYPCFVSSGLKSGKGETDGTAGGTAPPKVESEEVLVANMLLYFLPLIT